MTQTCVILGANGQMGQACLTALRTRDYNVIGLSKSACDITQSAALDRAFETHRPAIVINTAAFTNVDACETAPAHAHAINAIAPGLIAQTCARHHATLIHLSTDYVFGDTDGATPPHDETVPPCPLNVYGHSKLAGEIRVREALERHIILRTSWVFSATTQNFLKTMMDLSDKRDMINVVSDEMSCPTFAPDLAAAIVAVVDASLSPCPRYGTWHACGGEGLSRLDFAAAIMDARRRAGARTPVLEPITQAQFGAPALRPKDSRLSCANFTRDFGMTIPSFADTLDQAVHAMLSATKESVS
jgi:dTDP-4-dehydrorhamnose reductase